MEPRAHRVRRSRPAQGPADAGGLTLGIETSCDETSVAVVDGGRRTLSNVIHSQVQLHAGFGGVVPELAARDHLERLPGLLELALDRAAVKPSDIELIAATRGPGLSGCLLVGTGLATGLSAAWSVPLTGVNHLWGHIYAAMLAVPDLQPPLLGLVVSGAHSDLVRMPEHGRFEVIGRTRDDAAGEAFDKAARMLGLGYPGGPALDRLARQGDPRRQRLPRPSLPSLEFSFSGLKTALLYRLRDLGGEPEEQTRADLAAAFEESVVESLLEKLDAALDEGPSEEVVVAGGVAANTLLRRRAAEVVGGRARLTMPPLELCTDNAAMIAAAGHFAARRPAVVDPSLGWGA
ncbi:MAG TPA: tRNA (adenosine(37)-N6)-threonylcarbamoyltransferase complex transferase subunit TsaD [Candidatus Dormibacteraeota bacterium]|nr:tRNA (adenosine(37)-N6)-threonylcarbamoyltransferase complex transferase subunit TsaD [Candidatus Dormibacteraeota bacterium]